MPELQEKPEAVICHGQESPRQLQGAFFKPPHPTNTSMVVVGFPRATNVHVYFNPDVNLPGMSMMYWRPGLTCRAPMSPLVEWQLMLIAWVMSFSKVILIPSVTVRELVSSTRVTITTVTSSPPFDTE